MEAIRSAVAVEPDDRAADGTSAPNFSACVRARPDSACPEIPVGKAEVVLDARARSRLAAWRRALEDENVQPFRCAIHGGGESRRPGTDDDHVVHVIGVEVTLRPIVDASVSIDDSSDVTAVADKNRHLVDADLKAIEQTCKRLDRSRHLDR